MFQKQIAQIIAFLNKNPKRFYYLGMIVIMISLIFTVVKGVFFPTEVPKTILPSSPISRIETKFESKFDERGKQVEIIAVELQRLMRKKEEGTLTTKEAERIEQLLTVYKNLK